MERKRPPQIPKTELKFPTRTKNLSEHAPGAFRFVLIFLIVALVIILTGLLFWLYTLQQPPATATPSPTRPTPEENNEPESATAEAAVVAQLAVSPSTELDAIAVDLDGTTIIDLEPLFVDIEAMFTNP